MAKRARIRPLKAMRYMRELIANKEDTEAVFHIIRALNGDAFERAFQDFMAHPLAKDRIAQARTLPPILDDHARWLALPPGTFGREYVEFMRREGLTAAGLVEESLKSEESRAWRAAIDPLRLWYADRSRDTHDLFHILTGLGRDAMGETSVLSFTYPQHGNGMGLRFIAYMGAREASKAMPKGAPWKRSLRECREIGARAECIEAQDLIALFPLPLSEVRERLNIATPTAYQQCHALCKDAGIDPYDLVAA